MSVIYVTTKKSRGSHFVQRSTPEQFRNEDPLICYLFDKTSDFIRSKNRISNECTLKVFNLAYFICWMAIDHKLTSQEIESNLEGNGADDFINAMSKSVACAILSLMMPFAKVSQKTFTNLFSTSYQEDGHYMLFSFDGKPKLSKPIKFSSPIDTISTSNPIKFSLRNAIDACKREIQQLKDENAQLRNQLRDTEQKLHAASSPDSPNNMINCDTICRYAFSREDPSEVKMVIDMLNDIDIEVNDEPSAELRKIIRKLKSYMKKIQKPQSITQTNTNCQQFYGAITDSDFNNPK